MLIEFIAAPSFDGSRTQPFENLNKSFPQAGQWLLESVLDQIGNLRLNSRKTAPNG